MHVVETDSYASPAIDAQAIREQFYQRMTPISGGSTRFSADAINQPPKRSVLIAPGLSTIHFEKGLAAMLTGWAVDFPGHRNADAVYVLLDGKLAASCAADMDRPDVAAALGDRVFEKSGFACVIPATQMSAGHHRVTLRIAVRGGRQYYEASLREALIVS